VERSSEYGGMRYDHELFVSVLERILGWMVCIDG
jgi:hypothetical protein